MTRVDAWLAAARDALAREAGLDPAALQLSEADADTLLEIARVAAHESGARTNAPLVCYLVGLASRGGADLDRLAGAVKRSSS
jgi:hypothetical protein